MMVDILEMPVAFNVCGQVLREVERHEDVWSMAHVIMNPLAESLPHKHTVMTEIYVITKGFGELLVDDVWYEVAAGSVFSVPINTVHMLKNRGVGQLEHLVLALPPFMADDVEMVEEPVGRQPRQLLRLPEVERSIDGAAVIAYGGEVLSVAFGWSTALSLPKRPHFHKVATEYLYVIEGQGVVVGGGGAAQPVRTGSWVKIEPGVEHGLMNERPEDLVAVCVCSPGFASSDVYYK